jgi:hypothetical protein
MTEQFVGYTVSVTCRNELGSYQGQICSVDPKEQTITLKKAFKNGIPQQVPEVTLRCVLSFVFLFHEAVSILDYVVSNDRMI